MYSETDLQDAVTAGAISQEAADAFRTHVTAGRPVPVDDEEHFRFVTGFNDIFVAIASIIMLVAAGGIGGYFNTAIGGALVAATSWGLAEFFTKKRRMAFPSIILLIGFIGGIAYCFGNIAIELVEYQASESIKAVSVAAAALLTAGGAWLHWKRFMVPITVAAGSGALAVTAIMLVLAALNQNPDTSQNIVYGLILLAGLVMFALAMRWDMSDTARQTRRSDVAFWLHLLSAPMIAHPLFRMMGATGENGEIGGGVALGALGVYVVLALVAIIVDRRAILVSALAYVLAALTFLIRQFGVVELNIAITALVIGSALLCLSAFWPVIRRAIVSKLAGGVQAKLPPVQVVSAQA
jgi:hypothetical protein